MMIVFSCNGMSEHSVSAALSSYDFGELVEIIEHIEFYKGLFTFHLKTPDGFHSWKQWLYVNNLFPAMNRLLIALHRADGFDPYQHFEDQNGVEFAYVHALENGQCKIEWK